MDTPNSGNAYEEALVRIAVAARKKSPKLILSGLGLEKLPPEVSNLTHLRVLDLSDNTLVDLPAEIEQLKSLQSLTLANNSLRVVPAQIARIGSLVQLDLDRNGLEELPSALWNLPKLSSLSACANKIAALPEIGCAKNLQSLYLHVNRLASLPGDLFTIRGLTALSVFFNEITELPAEIGELTELTRLDLYRNKISNIPSEIVKLTKLDFLDIGKNPLSSVPTCLRSLTSLTVLRMVGLDLKILPSWLPELPQLESLLLHHNPSLELSPAVLGELPSAKHPNGTASAKVILDFYFGRQEGATRPLNEVKLILVGRGGAGKTSTVRALRGEMFNEDESSTPGIALSDWKMAGCRREPVIAHVWDFAGQVITHSLHQFFFSVRSVYVLVLTGRENNERDDAEYWLRLIKAFGTDDLGNGPPVIVALNKWDVAGCRPRVDRGALQERYPFIRKFVELDCKSTKGVETLRSALCREVDRLTWVHEPFPLSWDRVRRALASGRGEKAHLAYSEYRALCRSNGVSDERQQDSLAEILHNLGVALNYRNDPRLREATVLQPDWLTRNVYALVRRAEKQAGTLTQSDVDSVLRYEKDSTMRAYLLRIMERFEIAYSPRGTSGLWLVPQALPDEQAKGVVAFRDAEAATRLRYTYQALPEGLVARAIVRLNEFIEEVGQKKQQWASGVIITRDSARALIRTESQDRQVVITVTGPPKARQQLAGLCQVEMRDIHAEIRGLEPLEETQVQGAWVSTAILEMDERNRRQTGVSTKDRGTVLIDPSEPNNAYSERLARSDQWKPTVFISYSKSDVTQRKQLEIQLKILMNEGLVDKVWHDRMIDPGDLWDNAIQRQLKEADIVIILVSSAALATDYITENEIPEALRLHKCAKTIVIPVVLETCRWAKTELGTLNVLPEKGKALNKWKPPADGWNSVANGIAVTCEKLMNSRIVGTEKRSAIAEERK